jgi:molybdate transport system substrate-binding protein
MSFVLTALVALLGASAAQAADLVVLCPNALATAVGRVAEENRTATGVGARLVTGTAGGLAAQASAGAAGDVIISTTAAVADLERRGVARAGSRVEVGVIFIGVAVQKGARPPDVTTSEALRRALLDARSIGYADPARGGTGGIIFARVLDQLGIADAVRDKTRLFPQGTHALDAVARGEIELAVSPVSEIVVREGLLMAGRLPAALDARPSYSAAVLAATATPDAARGLIERLVSPSGRAALAAVGFDPPEAR